MKIGEHVPNTSAVRMYERFRSYVGVEDNVCAFFERDFLARRRWQAAVVSEELYPAEAEKLAALCRQSGYEKAWAMDIDHFDTGFFYSICLQSTPLSMLEEVFVTPSYLLVEQEERFTLDSDSDYFWEIAGPQTFIENLFQKPLATVNREFMDATKDYRHGRSRIGRSLSRIATEATERSLPAV